MTDTRESAVSSRRIVLTEDQLPTHWYNLNADLPEPVPPHLHPGTKAPLGPEDLAPLFPSALIAQEVTTERFVPIPEPVREVYATWRPSPLVRASNLEQALGTPARIYYKYEGLSPVGSHKPNTAVAQAYYNAAEGVGKITTETGAGQWGSALAYACALFGLECEVWQVAASYATKPYRRMLMETYGASVHSSPSELTEAGRGMRAKFGADTPGSLGMAVSEAVEAAATDPNARYALGSVLNHVMLHQTVIGEETLAQLAIAGERPDVVVGCAGGGSNLAGLAFPFVRENLAGQLAADIVAVEPTAAPSMTKGEYRYDFGDVAGLTPLLKMYTLGRDFVPDPIHAGGLRYHGMAPMVSSVVHAGLMRAVAIDQDTAFAAGVLFARTEGVVPAPESDHAVAVAVETARQCASTGEDKVIVLGLSGSGQLDLPAYADYLSRP